MNTADVVLVLFAVSAVSVVFLLVGPFSGSRDVKDIQLRLRRLEGKLDALTADAGITTEVAGLRDVEAQIAQGNKIAAIKAYREETGAGLADAKSAVERMQRGEQP